MASKGNTNLKAIYTAWAAAFFGFVGVTISGLVYVLYHAFLSSFSFLVVVVSVLFFLSALVLAKIISVLDNKIKKVFGCNIKEIIDERNQT